MMESSVQTPDTDFCGSVFVKRTIWPRPRTQTTNASVWRWFFQLKTLNCQKLDIRSLDQPKSCPLYILFSCPEMEESFSLFPALSSLEDRTGRAVAHTYLAASIFVRFFFFRPCLSCRSLIVKAGRNQLLLSTSVCRAVGGPMDLLLRAYWKQWMSGFLSTTCQTDTSAGKTNFAVFPVYCVCEREMVCGAHGVEPWPHSDYIQRKSFTHFHFQYISLSNVLRYYVG